MINMEGVCFLSGFIEVTVNGYRILLNLKRVVDIEEFDDGSCRINLRDDYIEPDESYTEIRDMIKMSTK